MLALGLMGSVFAFFTDSATSTGNTFTSGTLDLELSDANDGFGPPDSVTVTWTMSNMEPGVTTVGPLPVNLQNTGTIAADHVEIAFSHSIAETPDVESDTNWNSNPWEMAEWLEIISMTYNGSNWVTAFSTPGPLDPNNNGFFDLEDLTLSPYTDVGGPLDDLPVPPPNSSGTTSFVMALKFNAGATNDIQGDTLTTTVTFTLNQEASQ